MSGPDETPKAGSEETHGAQAPQGPVPPAAEAGQPEGDEPEPAARGRREPAAARLGEERLAEQVVRTGMFGTQTTGTPRVTAGCGSAAPPCLASPRPYGSYFDDVADELGRALESAGIGFADAIERVVADRGELTFYVRREHLPEVAAKLRDDPALRLRAVHRGIRGALPGRRRPGAARGLPPAVDHAQPPGPARGDRAGRRPAHPVAGRASTRPATGTSGRPGTSSASSSTATRR